MRDVIERLKRIAPTNASVLIQGETGTGKELVAQAIHQNSPRKNKPFVALNCAALSENILESELFGHVKGAFTDASTDRVGKFEYAHGGTMFLDEVGDMPLATQIKLLRVLENGEITRVGSNNPIKVNVRILSATNRNLEDAIAAGTFRSDLYHRLKVVTIRLPTLRERSQDIPILIDYFIRQFAAQHGKQIKGMSPAARHRLLAFDWPGNVRQLRNVVESMVVVDYDGLLDVDDLPEELAGPPEPVGEPSTASLTALVGKPLDGDRAAVHRRNAPRDRRQPRRGGRRCWASASGRCIGRSRSMGCRGQGSGFGVRMKSLAAESTRRRPSQENTTMNQPRPSKPKLSQPPVHPALLVAGIFGLAMIAGPYTVANAESPPTEKTQKSNAASLFQRRSIDSIVAELGATPRPECPATASANVGQFERRLGVRVRSPPQCGIREG